MPVSLTTGSCEPGTDLSEAQWRVICPSFTLLTFSDKQAMSRQGEDGEHVFYIAKGRVKLSRLNQHGDQFTVAVLAGGQWFGAMLSDHPIDQLAETAHAKGRVTAYRVSLKEFKTLLSHRPQFAWQVITTLSARQRALEHKFESLLFKDVRSRVADTLRQLAGSYGMNCKHGYELDITLTQQELADLVGASRPVVSTIVNGLRDRGVLEYHRNLICIKQLDALDRLTSF